MKFTFWGTRGSIPVPGPSTLRYGGNSTCCELDLAGQKVIIDAGSGIRPLGDTIKPQEGDLILLMTHLHWDHVDGFPFFAPAYTPGAVIRVGGWPRGIEGLEGLFRSSRFDGNFPVAFEDLQAKIFRDRTLSPTRFNIGPVEVGTIALNHPQGAIGFRFDGPGGRLVFITDNELDTAAPAPPKLVDFCRGADILIHDAQYTPTEMETKKGWGHSDWRSCIRLAQAAGAKRLLFTHHDPGRSDQEVNRLVKLARAEAEGLPVEAAAEGLVLEV